PKTTPIMILSIIMAPARGHTRHTRHLVQPGVLRLLLQLGESSGGLMVANELVLLIVSIGSERERPIVDEPSAAKGPSKDLFLLSRRIPPILVGSFLVHTLHGSIDYVENQAPFICRVYEILVGKGKHKGVAARFIALCAPVERDESRSYTHPGPVSSQQT